jgi:hypothetical protein
MKRSLIVFVIFAAAIISAEELETRKTVKKAAAIDLKNELEARTEESEVVTIKVEVVKETSTAPLTTTTAKVVPIVQDSTTEKVVETSPITSQETLAASPTTAASSSTNIAASTTESSDSNESEGDDNESSSLPPKRKVLYLNQQQNGRLNVHLELSDVSLIVVPKSKDPQLSLLNLLFKSAQKSNMKKKEQEMKVEHHSHDEYSKYKHSIRPSDESYQHLGSTVMPFIESRAPYKVDISSTLGQQSQPAVDIMPNSHQQHAAPQQFQSQFARSPIMQLLKPIPYTIQTAPGQSPHSNRIFKRSIDSRLLGIDDEIPSDEDELTESVFNSLDNHEEDINGIDRFDGSDFVLLGATENCGPGRKRNSYQICVAVDNE